MDNSRFLILPWVRVQNLASAGLAQTLRRLEADRAALYGDRPVLVETLVDPARFAGHRYRAANFRGLGPTAGCGRMDRGRVRVGAAVKTVWVYPLVPDARRRSYCKHVSWPPFRARTPARHPRSHLATVPGV